MAVIRTEREENFKVFIREKIERTNEWQTESHLGRLEEPSWIQRYEYESNIISELCNSNNLSKVIEFGSGPGTIGDLVNTKVGGIDWTNIDKPGAKDEFEKRGYSGKFHIKNLLNTFDTSGLDRDYNLIVANDFLEHIANPSEIISTSYDISTDDASIFISVPNWRMGHEFIYRGLFDYDNFIYFMWIHGWEILEVKPSPLKTQYFDKLSSEESMPDELIQSWNWYFIGKKRSK
jgi:2-polyprenyl-3-methyl-5-hydroxy-6-metoxy-1,4-benzoquinol methylase